MTVTDLDMPTTTEIWGNATSLERLGITSEDIEALEKAHLGGPTQLRAGFILDVPGGQPIAGLVYQTDYKAEEEYGVGELRKAITSADPRRFVMTDTAIDNIAVFDDVNGMVLSTRRLLVQTMKWGDPLNGEASNPWYTRYAERWNERVGRTRALCDVADPWMKMDKLRAVARDLGISPLPRRKNDLVAAIHNHPRVTEKTPDVWPAWFANGKELVLRADGDTMCARIMRKLIDAVTCGTLAIGNASGPFSTGLFFYDARDETPELVEEREARFDWHDARMAELEPVAEALKADGIRWFALGRPTEINGQIKYWLNGSSTHKYPQPYGWYTLQELADKKFIDDARERKS